MVKGDKFFETFVVSDNVYNGFIALFKDLNPLHTDNEFAVLKGFQGKVMHGNILNGFLSYFIGEGLPNKNVIIHTQSIKFLLPVYLGDVLNFYAEIVDFFESVNTIEFKFQFENNKGKKIAKGNIQIGLLL